MALTSAKFLQFSQSTSLFSPSSRQFQSQFCSIPPLNSSTPSITTISPSKSVRQTNPSDNRSGVVVRASTSEVDAQIGDVSIFTASGEPFQFKDLWDQNEA